MAGKHEHAIIPVKEATGADVTLYTRDGRLEGATGKVAPFRHFSDAELAALPVADPQENATYFAVRSRPVRIGIIEGCDAATTAYARLAAKLLETELSHTVDDAERMRLLLSGEATEAQILALSATFRQGDYYMLALFCPQHKLSALDAFMQTFKDERDFAVKMDATTMAYVRAYSADDEYQSANEFANVLRDNLSEELPFDIKIGIGDVVHTVEQLETGYSHAVFACRYGRLIDPASDVYSYKEYALVKILAEVKTDTFARYAASLIDDGFRAVLDDGELMTTAEMFMKNSLNISETSRSMYMHRNTLIYRLDKIEKATGLNIRQFNDAFTFRLIHLMHKLSSV